eukprot:CAMPEP_0171825950 /NCGR_PEP_ID=MMETSP0992-20121227/5814_1 /TAXON_ID=483369 /ORGANISM="non described non described, Strain CCMP2098" /LENGTH=287 /DNA_ID=CAMNT_0012440923 /DNA_START=112 /DNA_END=975 /DNA_ORIENTATION=+
MPWDEPNGVMSQAAMATKGGGEIFLPAPAQAPATFSSSLPGTSERGGNKALASADGIKQLGWVKLACHVTWPLTAVVTPRSLASYNKALVLLLQVKYALSALEGVRWQLLKHRRRNGLTQDGLWHKVGLDHGVVLHVVSSLHGYLATHCAASHWPSLVSGLRSARSVAELRSAHESYLHTVLERCMLLPRAAKVLEYLHRVLSGALRFATLVTSLHHLETRPNTSGDKERARLVKELQTCFATFIQDLKYVHAVGERLVATRLAPYLSHVLLVLDFNAYFEQTLPAY